MQNIKSKLDKIKQSVLNRIKVEHDKVMGAGKESDDNLKLLFKNEKDLRGLLSQSNGLMVTKFPEVILQVRTVHEVQQNLDSLEVEDIEHQFEANGFEATAQDFLKQCIERIQMPLLKNISEPDDLSELSDSQDFNHTFNLEFFSFYLFISDFNDKVFIGSIYVPRENRTTPCVSSFVLTYIVYLD